MMEEQLNLEIWDRFFQGKSLDGLPLKSKEGRLDLGGLVLPEPTVLKRYQTSIANVTEIAPSAVIQKAKWRDFDFTGSKFNGLRLFGCEIYNCKFDNCKFQDLRIWASKIEKTSFRGANLKKAVLGGVESGKLNTFLEIDFSNANLEQTVYTAASFRDCKFDNAKLSKIDFQSSSFVDCHFAGELNDVLFYDRGAQGSAFPVNDMINVDFSDTVLKWVGFRRLNLANVKFPVDSNHLIIKDYSKNIDKLISAFNQQGDKEAKIISGYLNIGRKWMSSDQKQGVLNLDNARELVSEHGVSRLVDAVNKLT